ncbi:tRNA-splicing endonuclease subunit sen54 N-term-domain-containing protein [Exophiala viscosa]|uniref:tRNA-splicing endonuclease subunit sen54 N-term-domain-containing protein n=1 Tax=Exophiala viscosa TaxID=2486360 RepID=A0AAN6DTK1_9EURO|nr:tRNA-splicing endonuclease subunit sen54 N-term-domain-containing protein [Exophiala viscosa]
MADADEDAIHITPASGHDDLEDETQDFRFLTQLTSSSAGQAVIPKRGTKDFEPNPTRSQSSALDASRLAMHTALSAVRLHSGKNHIVGQYLPDENDWRFDDNGSGVRHARCVVVPRFKSTHLKVMGVADRYNWTWFLPEEALFLLERGSLDIRWPDMDRPEHDVPEEKEQDSDDAEHPTGSAQDEVSTQDTAELEDHPVAPKSREEPEMKIGELPMSLQGAYASFIGKDGLTLERYSVYAALKRAGYVVQRAPTWHDVDPPRANGDAYHNPDQPQNLTTTSTRDASQPLSSAAAIIHRLVSWLFQPRGGEQSCPALGPLVAPGLYRNYADIFRSLALIPYHDASSTSSAASSPQPSPPQPPFRVHFHVWKPVNAHTYRKTAPPPPDYRIVVVDARTTSVPTLTQIGQLLDTQPEDSLSKEKGGRLEVRIKHGRRNVLLAIVDMGVVSYLRLSDACFGAEKLFEEKARSGSKGQRRGAGGGGRGGARHGQGRGQGQPKGK